MTSEVVALLDTRMLVLAYVCCSHMSVPAGPATDRIVSEELPTN